MDKLKSGELAAEYAALLLGLRKIGALNVAVRLVEPVLRECPAEGLMFALSDDFPEPYTTLLSDDELAEMVAEGQLKSTVKELSVIAMCSLFESYVNRLVEIAGVDRREAESYNRIAIDFGLNPGSENGTLRKIYYLIRHFDFRKTPFLHDQSLNMLHELFTIRNVLVHSNGVITRQNHANAVWRDHQENGRIVLDDNSIDDFLHRIIIHMRGFTRRLDEIVPNCT